MEGCIEDDGRRGSKYTNFRSEIQIRANERKRRGHNEGTHTTCTFLVNIRQHEVLLLLLNRLTYAAFLSSGNSIRYSVDVIG